MYSTVGCTKGRAFMKVAYHEKRFWKKYKVFRAGNFAFCILIHFLV